MNMNLKGMVQVPDTQFFTPQPTDPQSLYFGPQDQILSIFDSFWLCGLYETPVTKPRSDKTIATHNFTVNMRKLHNEIINLSHLSEVYVKPYRKARASTHKKVSKRRSQFIGVTKNSRNYQALIVIKGKKTYIGSFETELEAAQKYDWHAMLLHGRKATTNFVYTGDDVLSLIAANQGS